MCSRKCGLGVLGMVVRCVVHVVEGIGFMVLRREEGSEV